MQAEKFAILKKLSRLFRSVVFPLLIPIILIAGTAGSLAIQAGTSQTPQVKPKSKTSMFFEEFKPILIIVAIIVVFMLLLGGKKRR